MSGVHLRLLAQVVNTSLTFSHLAAFFQCVEGTVEAVQRDD